MNNSPK